MLTGMHRRRRERLGNQCLIEINHIPTSHGARYHL